MREGVREQQKEERKTTRTHTNHSESIVSFPSNTINQSITSFFQNSNFTHCALFVIWSTNKNHFILRSNLQYWSIDRWKLRWKSFISSPFKRNLSSKKFYQWRDQRNISDIFVRQKTPGFQSVNEWSNVEKNLDNCGTFSRFYFHLNE